MVKDENKDITAIEYNYLNLPEVVEFSNGQEVEYWYDAAGVKLRKVFSPDAGSNDTTDYVGGFHYSNSTIEFVQTVEGRYVFGTENEFQYHLKDHLGNTRATVRDDNGSVEVIGRDDYYPFGGAFNSFTRSYSTPQKYKYNGKELQEETELYDYGARMYDSWTGRFRTIDPMSEMTISETPYHYVSNNPIAFVDPTGMYKVNFGDGFSRKEKRAWRKYIWNSVGTNTSGDDGGCPDNDPDCLKQKSRERMGTDKYVPDSPGSADELEQYVSDWEQGKFNLQTEIVKRNAETSLEGVFVLMPLPSGGYAVVKISRKLAKWLGLRIIKKRAVDLTRKSVDDKLARYLLNPDHPIGGSKAKWFKEALGFTKNNADDLAKQIVFNSSKATKTAVTEHGVKYNQIISITGANGRTIDVNFAWIKNNDGITRLVTSTLGKK